MTSDLQITGPEVRPDPAPPPFQILCLSGGGYRGLYTAALLEELEKEENANKSLSKVFDLIAGTSIGGILAIGLAAGIPAKTLRESFEKSGSAIFPRSLKVLGVPVFPRLGSGMLFSKYGADGLRATIEAVLGSTVSLRPLKDLKEKVLIASVDVTNSGPKLFGIDGADSATPLLDIALATSAAPTYFPEHRIDQNIYVDGGLIANAPDIIALMHTLQREPSAQIQMLSIGTVGELGGEASRAANRRGWLLRGKGLVDLTLAAQEKLSISLTANFLGQNYIRLDANPSQDQQKAIGLDRTDQEATDTLKALARKTAEDGLKQHQAKLRAMLNRTAK